MDFKRVLRVGTRRSPLALKQAEEVFGYLDSLYPGIRPETVGIDTYGDRDKITPICELEGTDFFTREIDEALLRKEIDFAVHSAKDLPERIPEGLGVAAITKPVECLDALVSKNNLRIEQLRFGAKVGASSLRRKMQLKAYRADLEVIDIRGNIQDRLRELDESDLEAVIIASCALLRLGLESRIAQRIPSKILRPHPLQGSLAVVARKEDSDLIELLSSIDSRERVAV